MKKAIIIILALSVALLSACAKGESSSSISETSESVALTPREELSDTSKEDSDTLSENAVPAPGESANIDDDEKGTKTENPNQQDPDFAEAEAAEKDNSSAETRSDNNLQENPLEEQRTVFRQISVEEKANEYTSGSTMIIIGDVYASTEDETVTVQAYIKNNPGILGMLLTMQYDSDNLELVDAVSGEALKEVLDFTAPNEYVSPCNFVWDGVEISPEQAKDGVFLELKFSINNEAPNGKYPIFFFCDNGNAIDNNLAAVPLNIVDGAIFLVN